jgi:DNA-binding transcriptional regulator YiaG
MAARPPHNRSAISFNPPGTGNEKANEQVSKDLVKSMSEPCDHAEGSASGARVHVTEVPDVRAIRRKLHLSQQEFAREYRFPRRR